ncbi:SpoIIE family protein phosphatase [Actinacidiphila acidipaludis]|uniref:Serine/threonine-protein phosphatase n=1 Tax=Actinacidiphila acidipaludis TaxID=2873382 RepID=A0ABS7Q2H0_9ACTN|nr:SpoIIE family protein phosphatase [Streptomyces acidipaludis]MBY8877327.1 serine/threonine-protein phosphatase [Streptomyces acidipaludis]
MSGRRHGARRHRTRCRRQRRARARPPADLRGIGSGVARSTAPDLDAGHPPPLLVAPDGMVHRMDEHGPLVHSAIGSPPRAEGTRVLPAGGLLLLYTDGLVEHRGSPT